jgi:ABC-2 type transport system ATP-binding protein
MNTALAIETQHLSKFYGSLHAVEAVDLRVARGEIYGFLGLNGAGKTTTIRTLLGMVRPSAGSVKILGQAVGPNGRGPWRRVGHMVEAPAAYPELTVRENLEIARRLQAITDTGVVGRSIERLNLGAYADRKAGVLSTGNLQRLGLARALLHEPELLILDEPANGLDPAGVVEVRELLVSLVREKGMTVFMSSHILTEVDRLATRIGIIHRGHLLEELEAEQIETLRARRLEIRARSFDAAHSVLAQAGYTVQASDHTLCLYEAKAVDAPDEVAALLVKAGVALTHLAVHQEDLEAYFLRLTGEKS